MNLKEFLDYKKMSQTELSDYLDLKRITIHRILKGQEMKLSVAFYIQKKTKGLVKVKDLNDFHLDQKINNKSPDKKSKKGKHTTKLKD